jgi:hypothetical protein
MKNMVNRTFYLMNYKKNMYNVVCILSVYIVIFLINFFEMAIGNAKNTLVVSINIYLK